MLSGQRGTDSLNVLGEGARGAPAASDVSIIPGGIRTQIWLFGAWEREKRCRAIDRPADHAHPGETRARWCSKWKSNVGPGRRGGRPLSCTIKVIPTYLLLMHFPFPLLRNYSWDPSWVGPCTCRVENFQDINRYVKILKSIKLAYLFGSIYRLGTATM